MVKILAVILFTCFFNSVALSAVEVANPMELAESVSMDYSYGDVEDEAGWKGCVFISPQESADVVIHCHGTVTSLLYGNRPLTEPFECVFEFQKSANAKTYLVLKRACE